MESGGGKEKDGTWSTKSCKGYLMYNESRRVKGLSPRCIGLSHTSDRLRRPSASELEVIKDGKRLIEFYYGCVGYGVYRVGKDITNDKERIEMPDCPIGIQVYFHVRGKADDTIPAVPRDKEEAGKEMLKPIHPTRGEDFYSRFTRNAGLVASRMLVNMVTVKICVKRGIDEILGRRPK